MTCAFDDVGGDMTRFVEKLVDDDLLGGCLGGVAEGKDSIGEVDRLMVNAESLKLKKIGGFCVFRNHYQAIKGKTPQEACGVFHSWLNYLFTWKRLLPVLKKSAIWLAAAKPALMLASSVWAPIFLGVAK